MASFKDAPANPVNGQYWNGMVWNDANKSWDSAYSPIQVRQPGLIPIKPTAVVAVSGTATVNDLGTVSITGCQNVELRGIFSSGFRNYKIIFDMNKVTGSVSSQVYVRLLSGGTTITTGYANGFNGVEAGYTAVTQTNNSTFGSVTYLNNTAQFAGGEITVFKPNLSTQTLFMADTLGYAPGNTLYRSQAGIQHTATSAYDGLTLGLTDAETYTGKISIFGVRDI